MHPKAKNRLRHVHDNDNDDDDKLMLSRVLLLESRQTNERTRELVSEFNRPKDRLTDRTSVETTVYRSSNVVLLLKRQNDKR